MYIKLVYLRAKRHDKVATIIFYFARAMSHATVQTDRLCCVALQAGTQKVGGNIRILGRIRALYSQSDFRGKY